MSPRSNLLVQFDSFTNYYSCYTSMCASNPELYEFEVLSKRKVNILHWMNEAEHKKCYKNKLR